MHMAFHGVTGFRHKRLNYPHCQPVCFDTNHWIYA